MKFDPSQATRKLRSSSGRITRLLFIAAVVLLVLEIPLLIKHVRHSYFALDWGFGFYAALGFLGALVFTFASGGLGALLRRPLDSEEEKLEQNRPDDLDERLR